MDHTFEYDFVISYASEDENIAKELYDIFSKRGVKAFYAPALPGETWGKNLYEYLQDVYSNKGLFCIPIISEHYVRKVWTRHEWKSAQERALASVDKEYILPVRVDNTVLPGLPNTIGYLDIQETDVQSIAEIALGLLARHQAGLQIEQKVEPIAVWEYETVPFARSVFLNQNNYLALTSSDFAHHRFTDTLIEKKDIIRQNYVTLVVVPIPTPLKVDLNSLSTLIQDTEEETLEAKWMSEYPQHLGKVYLGRYNTIYTTREAYFRLTPPMYESPKELPFTTFGFIRFTNNGAIEFALPHYATYEDGKDSPVNFNFSYILGAVWKFLVLATEIYVRLGYKNRFQLLINLKNTQQSVLSNFASDKSKGNGWPSAASRYGESSFSQRVGTTFDQNLQFIFNINCSGVLQSPMELEAIIVTLSNDLQRSFNYKPKPRHYIPQTKDFPWHLYYNPYWGLEI
jgi:hypothetical protein